MKSWVISLIATIVFFISMSVYYALQPTNEAAYQASSAWHAFVLFLLIITTVALFIYEKVKKE